MRIASCWGGLLWLSAVVAVAQAPRWHLGTELTWHDNVTNGERPADRLAALEWQAEVSAGVERVLAGGHRIAAAFGVRTEIWPDYSGLDVIAPGISGRWSYKFGLGPQVPVVRAEVTGEWAGAREPARVGRGGTARLQMQSRAGPDWLFTAGHEWRRFDARSHAFDSTGREWFGRVEWTLGKNWFVTVEGRRRQGVVVSYSNPPRPDLAALGKPLTFVDTFEQATPWLAYYFRAETRSGRVELQRVFGRTTVGWQHEFRHTLHAGPGYRNQQTTLRLTTTF